MWATVWDGLEFQGERLKCHLVGNGEPLKASEHISNGDREGAVCSHWHLRKASLIAGDMWRVGIRVCH